MASSADCSFDPAARALEVLEELLTRSPLRYRPRIEWRAFRTTAGMAYCERGVIGLNRSLLTDESRLRDTLTHEFAHLLAYERHGRRGLGHGTAWRTAMLELGAEPRVRHDMPCARNAQRQRVRYRCTRCWAEFSRARRLRTWVRYAHVPCGGWIEFVEAVPLG